MSWPRPFRYGLACSCKSAYHGLGFPASEPDAPGTPRPYLPPDIVRLVDAIARRQKRAAWLLSMNGGNLRLTMREAARAAGFLDVRFLLAAGADAGAENGDVLYDACCKGHFQVAEAVLDHAGGTLAPHHHNSALGYAAAYGKLLLERGADIHYREDEALRWAAGNGHLLETIAFLLDRGADAWSESAMRTATLNHHDAVVALLLARRGGGAAAQ